MSLLKRDEGRNSVISLVAVSACPFCEIASHIYCLAVSIVLLILCSTNCNAGALHSGHQSYQQGSSRVPRTGRIIVF
jgi:hypothetical protein